MHPRHQGIHRKQQLLPRCGIKNGAVITDAEGHIGTLASRCLGSKTALDQLEFRQRHDSFDNSVRPGFVEQQS